MSAGESVATKTGQVTRIYKIHVNMACNSSSLEECMKASLIAVLALTCTLAVTLGTQAQEAKVHSMTGCLRAGPTSGTYMLTDVETGPKTIGIVSSTQNLAPHVGHKVEITGTAVPEADAMKENKDVPKAPHYMKLTALKHISPTCP
jgi:hypothetical protein